MHIGKAFDFSDLPLFCLHFGWFWCDLSKIAGAPKCAQHRAANGSLAIKLAVLVIFIENEGSYAANQKRGRKIDFSGHPGVLVGFDKKRAKKPLFIAGILCDLR